MPDLTFENKYPDKIIAGIDEAGRGPWAGPVVAGAVILDIDKIPNGLNDSKKLSKIKREKLYEEIIQSHDYSVGIVDEPVIDEINILQATKLAMKQACLNLKAKADVILVDGNQKIEVEGVFCENIIKGDSLSLSISAASIVAKVTRDRLMEDLSSKFPQYGWASNSGYGTKQHQEAISSHGITKHHRKSFAPIKKAIGG